MKVYQYVTRYVAPESFLNCCFMQLRARQRLARNTLQQLWGATFSENKDVQSSGSIDDTQALVAALMSRVLTYVI